MQSVKLYSLGVLLLLGACDQVKTETPVIPDAQSESLETQGQKNQLPFWHGQCAKYQSDGDRLR